jgi:replicative DNA helicase
MSTPSPQFKTALDVARSAEFDLDKKPERWHPGPPFDLLDLRPGRVILLGAPPGTGKTTLTLQLVSSVLANHPKLRAVVGNVEMAAGSLVEKLLARLAGVRLDALMNRELLTDERIRVEAAIDTHAALLARVAFLDPPFTLPHLGAAMQAHEARLAVVDYAQRFTTGDDDDRVKLDQLMSGVRRLATAGAGVILVSSLARQKSSQGGSTYDGMNMASFRGSAELEFGADSAYLLKAGKNGNVLLECVKQRFGQMQNVPLRFDGPRQTFAAGDLLDGFDDAPEPRTRRRGKE